MRSFNPHNITIIILIAFLVCSSSFSSCSARKSKKAKKGHHKGKGGSTPPTGGSTTFDVLDYGAKGDGKTDDTKLSQGSLILNHVILIAGGETLPVNRRFLEAFQAAWTAACKKQASTMLVPSPSTFLVKPISFLGAGCSSDIVFQLDGKIIAPTSSGAWGKGLQHWIEFKNLKGITFKGSGTLDGQGSVWWKDSQTSDPSEVDSDSDDTITSDKSGKMPSTKPTALRFYGSSKVTVTGITIVNSPQFHLKFDDCNGVQVFDMSVSSPGDSPNTDGIHLQNTQNVVIHGTKLACGDDCISIQTGSSNVYIHDVNCGPGHGISIGSLGEDNTKACVSNITVRDITIHNTMTGVRIKTWQGGSGSVQNVKFSNIQVSEVEAPIVIDQYYCDGGGCTNKTSAVAVSGISYENIKGTYTKKPVYFACSDSLPCKGISLATIELKAVQESKRLYKPFCWETYGELRTSTEPPIDCLMTGKPPSSGKPSSC